MKYCRHKSEVAARGPRPQTKDKDLVTRQLPASWTGLDSHRQSINVLQAFFCDRHELACSFGKGGFAAQPVAAWFKVGRGDYVGASACSTLFGMQHASSLSKFPVVHVRTVRLCRAFVLSFSYLQCDVLTFPAGWARMVPI